MKSKKATNRLLTLLLVLVMSITSFAESGIRVLAAGEDAAAADDDAVSEDAVSSDDTVSSDDAVTEDKVSENEADSQDNIEESDDTDRPSEEEIVPEEEDDADTFYNLWVGGVAVKDTNKNDIKGAVIGDDAKVTFDSATKTLYLYNVEGFKSGTDIQDEGKETYENAYIYYANSDTLNIVAEECYIDITTLSYKDYWLIYTAGSLNISGILYVSVMEGSNLKQIGRGIETEGSLTFKADCDFECKSIYCTIQSGNTVTVESGAYVNAEIVKYDTDLIESDQNALCVKKGGLTVDGGTLYLYCRKDGNNANALDVKGTLTLNAGSEFMAVNESKSTPDVSIYGSVKVSGDIIVDKSLYIYDKQHVKKDSDFRYVVNEKDEPSINVQVQEDNTPKLNIWIGGQQVTEGRAYDIWGLNVGSATYDKDTKVLTLNNAGGFKGINHDAWIDCDEEITIKGKFSLSMLDGTGVEYLIRSVKDLTVDCNIDMTGMKAYPNRAISTLGDAKLIISGGTYKLRAKNHALYSYKDLVLSGGEIDALSSQNVICSGSANISFDGANVKAINSNNKVTVSAGGNIAFNKGTATIQALAGTAAVSAKAITMDTNKLCIASPEGAKIQGGKIVDAEGKDVSNLTITELSSEDTYGLWLGNTLVTKNNCSDILGDGKASYDPVTKTLTLNGVKDFGEFYKYDVNTYCIYMDEADEITIKGSAELPAASVGIYGTKINIDADLTINSDTGIEASLGTIKINGGKVMINSTKTGIYATGLDYIPGVIEVNGGELSVKTSADKSYALKATQIRLNGGKITAEGKEGAMSASSKITLSDKMLILEPKGGKLSADGKTITDVSGNTAKKVVMLEKTVQCTVKFDTNGHGTAPADVTLWSGECVERPEDPTEEGWIFVDWYKDKECTQPYDFNAAVTSDITIYAYWEELSLVSAMNPVPFIGESTEKLTLVKGQKFTSDALVGWSVDKAGKKYVSISKKGKISAKKATSEPVKIWNKDKTRSIDITILQPKFTEKTIKADVADASKNCGFTGFGDLPVAYFVSNPDVCGINLKGGELFFTGKGTSTITAYVNGKAYNCKLKVTENVIKTEHDVYMNASSKKSLKLSGVKFEKFEIAEAYKEYAELKKNTVVSKDKTGLVKVTGTAKDGQMYVFNVHIEKPAIADPSAFGYTDKGKGKYEISMKVGQEAQLFFETNRNIIVKCSKPEIAYASEDGYIAAMKPGVSKMTAKINGKTVSIKVTVTP